MLSRFLLLFFCGSELFTSKPNLLYHTLTLSLIDEGQQSIHVIAPFSSPQIRILKAHSVTRNDVQLTLSVD
jgi:hypothetical protein